MARLTEFFFDLLFPVRCLGCGRQKGAGNSRGFLCDTCRAGIPVYDWLFCPVCEKKLAGSTPCPTHRGKSHLKALGVVTSYENQLVKNLIWAFKYDGFEKLSAVLGELMAYYFEKAFGGDTAARVSALVPIPLHPRRERWRGFNQALLLSREFSERTGLPVISGLLRKTWRKPQMEITSRKERIKNVEGIFTIPRGFAFQNKNVVLIDDVSTSGATLEEAAKTLKMAGAKEIYGLVIARG